jgi:actin-related protein
MFSKNESTFNAVIVDNGTKSIKVGHAGDEAPREVISTLLGHSKFPALDIAMDRCDYSVGEKVYAKRGLFNLVRPIQERRIVDFDIMEKVWHHCFYESLKVDPSQNSVLLTESCEYTDADRRKCGEIFFEYFNVPSLYIGNQGTLGLFSTGNTKGVVLDSGEGGTHVIPIFEGYVSPYSVFKTQVSGRMITDFLFQLMTQNGLTFSKHYDFDIVESIKEQKCYVSTDFTNELREFQLKANTKDLIYELPDGETISLNKEQIEAPEILFNTKLVGLEEMGIGELIYRSYFSIDTEIKKTLFDKIFLVGGNTLFPNIAERVSKSIRSFGGSSINFKLHCPAERKFSTWIGGSILACLTPFESMWVTKEEYEEHGPDILNIKKI